MAPRRQRTAAARCGSLVPEDPIRSAVIDWLTLAGYDWRTSQLTSLAYDGLVAYRRVRGAAGATLVGGAGHGRPARPAATAGPTCSRSVPGCATPTARPVRPEDFRASMERFLRVTRDRFPAFFDGIVGAARCMRRPARCDLSAGIETDRRARGRSPST